MSGTTYLHNKSYGYKHLTHDLDSALNIYKMWMGWLAKAKDAKKGRPDGKNGRITQHGTNIHFVYHKTTIAILAPSGEICLAAGGYHTVTTKKRINKIIEPLGYRIIQRNYTWFIKRIDEGSAVALSKGFVLKLKGESQGIYKPTKMKGVEQQ